MTRFTLLAALGLGLALPAAAQTTEPAPTDPAAADTTTIEVDPERARELYDQGVETLSGGDYEAALATFNEALVYNPQYAAAELRRGQALAQLSRLEDARTAFESAIALAEASDAGNAATIVTAATRARDQIAQVLDNQAAAAQAEAAAQSVQAKVTEAIGILQGINITDTTDANFGPASEGYALLEQARMEGYDPNLVAEYYAIALNAMARGADAIPFAETALENNADQADTSRYHILLGLAHMGAGNTAEAQATFEAVEEGQSWHGWAQHFLGQVNAEG